jgi:calcineurin-like phosphoesterase family protein
MCALFATADCHYYHGNIIKYENRPFKDVAEMNETMIRNHNSVVQPTDTTFILGDFALARAERVNEIVARLNGKKCLILGGHDQYAKSGTFDRSQFEWVKDYHLLKLAGVHVVMFHYPIYSWECKYYGAIHLHGHVHSKTVDIGDNAFNVGVDTNHFTPVKIQDIITRCNTNKL